jgi:predicted DCC family thiol-disulfide oxidoreductase YuxK
MIERALFLYDGDCALCAGSVRFLAPRDTRGRIVYASIAGPRGRPLACAAGIDPDAPSTVLLVAGGRTYQRSDAVLEALRLIRPPWPLIGRVGQMVPRAWRDWLYRLIARNRYRLFGRACLMPDPAWADRVLD